MDWNTGDSILISELQADSSFFTQEICEGDTLTFAGDQLFENGTYQYDFLSQSGCDSIVSLTLVLRSPELMSLEETICQGDSLEWMGNVYSEAGIYLDTLIDNQGCLIYIQAEIEVNNPQVIVLEIQEDQGSGNGWIEVEGSGGEEPYSFLWNTGQTGTIIQQLSAGFYSVTMTDARSCTNSATVQIESENELEAPNAFTPNDDGVNDLFMPYLKDGDASIIDVFEVYSRWGERVYEYHAGSLGWDGTYRGQDAGEGIYVYSIRYRDSQGKEFYLTGDVLLLR